jgi:Domain of unknown function (DUF4340)
MNRKQLAFLLVLVIVLGAGGLLLYKKENASWTRNPTSAGQKLFDQLPVNDVVHLTLRQGTNEVNLVRKEDAWQVRERYDYPADFSQIRDFLVKAADLKAVRSEPVGASQWPRLQLAPAGQGTNAPVIVDFKGANDKPIASLLLGKKHVKRSNQPSPFGEGGEEGWPDGRYVRVGADSKDVILITDPLENIEPKAGQWLSKEFVRVEKARSLEVTFPVATNSWKLTRETETGEWKLANARPDEQLDTVKVAGVSSPLSATSFTDVLPGNKLSQSGTNAPTIVKIETFDGFTYTVRVGTRTNEEYLITVSAAGQIAKERTPGKDEKAEDKAKLDKEFKERQQKLEEKLKLEQSFGKWTYLVAAWGIDSLLKERAELLVEKKEEPKPAAGAATNSVTVEPTIENTTMPAGAPKP